MQANFSEDFGFSDDSFDIESFKKSLKIVVIRYEEREIEFDMIGVSPALANAFRRLMIAEVPSMAIEKVWIYNNTSIIQDEVLAHRLGNKLLENFKVFGQSYIFIY